MQRDELARSIRQVSRLEGSFTLRSGKVSDTYFDKYLFESDPEILRAIAEQMQLLVPDSTEVLCGLELGGIPIVTMLSQLCKLPAAFIRKTPKAYGTCKYAEGPSLPGKKIVLVEDVVSSGGAIVDMAKMLREDNIEVNRALCVIDRRSAQGDLLTENGVELSAIFKMQEIENA